MTLLRQWSSQGSTSLGLTFLFLAACLASTAPVKAQTPALPVVGSAFALAGAHVNGVRFDAASLRGNVTVVFYWSTGCAVCRDSLPELRANLAGWRNKPFSLVLANVDRQSQDWLSYERVLSQVQSASKGYVSVRQDDTVPSPARLPLTLLLDTKGKVLQRIEGRVAPEVWDSVAELLL